MLVVKDNVASAQSTAQSMSCVEVGGKVRYLGAKTLQLRCCHADQLHTLFIVGDGTSQVGHLKKEDSRKKRYYKLNAFS